MDIKKHINLEEVLVNLFITDAAKVFKICETEVEKTEVKKIMELVSIKKIDELYLNISNIYNEFVNSDMKSENHNLFIGVLMLAQRYNYFNTTYVMWKQLIEDNEELASLPTELPVDDVVYNFFSEQIDIYLQQLLQLINNFNLQSVSDNLFKLLNEYCNSVIAIDDFLTKIEKLEEFVIFLQDSKKIISMLEGCFDEADQEKFLMNLSEVKLVFQSLDELVKVIITDLFSV